MGAETITTAFPVLLKSNSQRKTMAKPAAGSSIHGVNSAHNASITHSVVSGSGAREAQSLKRTGRTPAAGGPENKSSNRGRSRLEFVGMALALHVLFGRKMREIIFMTKNYFIQAFSFGLHYLQKPWLLFSLCITLLFALLTTTALPYMESAADRERQRLKKEMENAKSYSEWRGLALEYERIETSLKDKLGEKQRPEDMGYDEELIESRVRHLKNVREGGSVRDMMFHLRTDLLRDLGNMNSMCPDSSTSVELPEPIHEYLTEVTQHLDIIATGDSTTYDVEERLVFLQETRHAFGRTALVLSGGGSFGTFHLGLIKTLIEHNLVPRVLAGSSVGAIACAFIATRSPEEALAVFSELDEKPERMGFYSGTSMRQLFGHYVVNGSLHSADILQKRLRDEIGDVTFQEAYDISGKILCITVSPTRKNESPRLLSYLTSPHVLVWSAVSASCAFPGLFPAQKLYAKDLSGKIVVYHGECVSTQGPSVASNFEESSQQLCKKETRYWRDGSLEDDLPLKRLSELFNANYFIVSQVNPHIIPFLQAKQKLKSCGRIFGGIASLMESEVKHRIGQLRDILGERGRSLRLLTQSWEGDVTIVMQAGMKQYQGLIFNPTKSEFTIAFRQGQLNTWPKLHIIEANMRIEKYLDDCVARLRRNYQSGFHPGGRVPSWNTLLLDRSNRAGTKTQKIDEGDESECDSQCDDYEDEGSALSKAADEILSLCDSGATNSCESREAPLHCWL